MGFLLFIHTYSCIFVIDSMVVYNIDKGVAFLKLNALSLIGDTVLYFLFIFLSFSRISIFSMVSQSVFHLNVNETGQKLKLLLGLFSFVGKTISSFLAYQIVAIDKIAFGFILFFVEKIYQGLLVTLL